MTCFHYDHLGTPRFGTNTGGTQVWTWASDAFGVGSPSGSATINLRMPGQYFDSESGLFYNWNRYYNPAIGRYISSDPIGLDGGLNTFNYAGVSPVMYTDPEGKNAIAAGGPATALAGSVIEAIIACKGNTYCISGVFASAAGLACYSNPVCSAQVQQAIDWCMDIFEDPEEKVAEEDSVYGPPAKTGTEEDQVIVSSRSWSCTASCNVAVYNPSLDGLAPDRVMGSASGKTEAAACVAAKRVATQAAPRGTYARHCQCTSCSQK